MRQLHRIGVGGIGRDDRARARNVEMLQRIAWSRNAPGKFARRRSACSSINSLAVGLAARYSESLSRMSQATPSSATSDFNPLTALWLAR
jgi:hypothetical protein